MINPIFLRIENNLTTKSNKNTGLINLCFGLISLILYILSIVLFFVLDDDDVVINTACISFFILVLLTILFSYKSFKNIVIYLIYSASLGISLSSISYATFNVLNLVFSYSLLIFIITSSMLILNLVESILYYIKGYAVNHFFYKFIFSSLITIVIIGIIMALIIKTSISVYFIYLILSLLTCLIYSFLLTMYYENIRKIKDVIDDKNAYDLSILTLTLPLYVFPEIFSYIFKKKK